MPDEFGKNQDSDRDVAGSSPHDPEATLDPKFHKKALKRSADVPDRIGPYRILEPLGEGVPSCT